MLWRNRPEARPIFSQGRLANDESLMNMHTNDPIAISDLPPARSWLKRLRHYRRDFQWRRRFVPPADLPIGRPDPACPDFSIAAIAVSEKYADWCLTMIESARERGGYSGPIYVVTDLPAWFAPLDNVFVIEVPYSRVRLLSKSLKPMLFEWLPQRYVAYIDADVIVAGPLSAWYRKSRDRLAEVDSPLLTYEVDVPISGSFHGGLLFAEREAALPFLRKWLAMLRSGRYLSDQVALRRTATPSTPAYQKDMDFCYLYQKLDGSFGREPVFVHITNRMIQEHPPEQLTAYIKNQLGVSRMPSYFGTPERSA